MYPTIYDTFEDEVATMKLVESMRKECFESMKDPHLWIDEPIRNIDPKEYMMGKSAKQ